MAIYKAKCHNAICTLVSASPSLESLYNLKSKKIIGHKLLSQFHKTELPEINVIDMNNFKPSSKSWISKQIYDETLKNLKDKNQVLFFKSSRVRTNKNLCQLSCSGAVSSLCC